jgi:hypothetical protein
MATLHEQFEQAASVMTQRKAAPAPAQADATMQRLESVHRDATEGSVEGREAAMRQFIELVGELGQQGG